MAEGHGTGSEQPEEMEEPSRDRVVLTSRPSEGTIEGGMLLHLMI